MRLFSARTLPEAELTAIGRHLADCPDCHRLFVSSLRAGSAEPPRFTLAPEFWLRREHLDYERLVELSENRLDGQELESIDAHLKLCSTCQEDVRGFLAFREEFESELKSLSVPASTPRPHKRDRRDAWHQVLWKPIYAAAAVILAVAFIIGIAALLKRSAEKLQADNAPIPQVKSTATQENKNGYATPPDISASTPQPPLAALNDNGRVVAIDKSGNASGIDDFPTQIKDDIARVLKTERLEPPNQKELLGEESGLRGSNPKPRFKLIYPARTVITNVRPTLRWEGIRGATSYQVYLNDARGSVVTKSDTLPSDRTSWTVNRPLRRGEVFTWWVSAIIEGKEVISPGPSSPEMKFKVLSARSFDDLQKLSSSGSHLALGVFCAREGLREEAQREFQILLRENPNSDLARKLLQQSRVERSQ